MANTFLNKDISYVIKTLTAETGHVSADSTRADKLANSKSSHALVWFGVL